MATTVDSHVAILSIAKKILELTSKKSRLPINNCLAYLVNCNTTLNEYMLDTLNKFETYYNTAQAFLKLMGSYSNPKLPSIWNCGVHTTIPNSFLLLFYLSSFKTNSSFTKFQKSDSISLHKMLK